MEHFKVLNPVFLPKGSPTLKAKFVIDYAKSFWEERLVFVKEQLVCFHIMNVTRPEAEALRSLQGSGLRLIHLLEKSLMLNFRWRQTQHDGGPICFWGKPDSLS